MADNGFQLTTLEASDATDVTFSADDSLIYVAKADGDIDVFDVATKTLVDTWEVGTSLGAISVSEDGSFLLVTEQTTDGQSVLYRVDTATGSKETFQMAGGAFKDVEIISGDTALITGGQPTVSGFDLNFDSFSFLASEYNPANATMVEDGHLTLFAVSAGNGPLYLLDDRTGAFVYGDNYQDGASSGDNWFNAVSEEAGLVVQFSYYGGANVYDLNLQIQEVIELGERVGGLVFDPSGDYLYAYLIDSGVLAKFETDTWSVVDEIEVGTAAWHNNIVYGSELLIDDTGNYITIMRTDGAGSVQIVDLTQRNETYAGTAGADVFAGGKGNDTYTVNNAGDAITELAHEGFDLVNAAFSYVLGANLENLALLAGALNGTGNAADNIITGNASANLLSGAGGDDVLYGANGSDRLDGGAGDDQMHGGLGNDVFVADSAGDEVLENAGEGTDTVEASVSFTLGDNVERLTLTGAGAIAGTGNAAANILTGNAGANVLSGLAGSDTLYGGGGDDRLDGGLDNDKMYGGARNDTYVVDSGGDKIIELAGEGVDTVEASVSYTLAAEVENLVLTAAALNGTGNALANLITGNALGNRLSGGGGDDKLIGGDGADRLDGGAGVDKMYGGLGDDVFVVDDAADLTIEYDGEGIDTVQASLSHTLRANVENLVLTGSGAIDGVGNAMDNTMTGNSGNNLLSGGSGADLLKGGDGQDTLDGGKGADVMIGGLGDDTFVVDNAGDVLKEGTDQGLDTVESRISWTLGANLENLTLTGAAAINATGNAGANTLTGNDADNWLSGADGFDDLNGGGGNDRLDGGAGFDSMSGGLGDDLYIVDSGGDLVAESFGAGIDSVEASVSYTLTSSVENLTLTGAAEINGSGNSGANLITGNNADNGLGGFNGDDHLVGRGGDDVLNGGVGADLLEGGTGDDTYMVDGGDTVIELAGQGVDLVIAFNDYTLGANLENLTVIGGFGVSAIGNELANTIASGDSGDWIEGRGGADTLLGGSGADTFGYSAVTDSGPGTSDFIEDFGPDDYIDLSAIDANDALDGNQAFVRIADDGAFTAAGQLRLVLDGFNTRLEVSTDADADAEMVILLAGNHTEATAEDGWFL